MSLFGPDMFAFALVSVMRLGKQARLAHFSEKAQKTSLAVLLPQVSQLQDGQSGDLAPGAIIANWAKDKLWNDGLCEPGKPLHGLFALGADGRPDIVPFTGPRLAPGRETDFEDALEELLAAQNTNLKAARGAVVTWHEQAWSKDDTARRQPWDRFARHVLDVSLDLVAERPEILGGGRSVRTLIAAVMPNLADAYDANRAEADGPSRLVDAFASAALETLIEQPGLIAGEARWQALTRGVLAPLQEEVARDGARFFRAERQLREVMRGPMGQAALKVISEAPDDYFKGEASSGRLAGAVLRATLGTLASTDASAFDLRKVFGGEGAAVFLRASLKTARERPDLFLGAYGEANDPALQSLLSKVAAALEGAPRPFDQQSGLAGEIAAAAIESVAMLAIARLAAPEGANAQRRLGAEIAAALVTDLMEGFKLAATARGASVLSGMFTDAQAVRLLKLVATHVTAAPGAFFGDQPGGRPPGKRYAVMIAEAVAQMISEDTTGLLTGEDWQAVAGAALAAALENPDTLFGHGPAGHIARVLTAQVLNRAREHTARAAGTPGRVLFGPTLRQALIETLDAASTGLLNTFTNEEALKAHLAGLDTLIEKLNAMAAETDRAFVIGSREWLRIYAYYVAEVLEKGPDAVNRLDQADLIAIVKQTRREAAIQEGLG